MAQTEALGPAPTHLQQGHAPVEGTFNTQRGHVWDTELLPRSGEVWGLEKRILAHELKCWLHFDQAAVIKKVKLKYRPGSGLTLVRLRKAAQ